MDSVLEGFILNAVNEVNGPKSVSALRVLLTVSLNAPLIIVKYIDTLLQLLINIATELQANTAQIQKEQVLEVINRLIHIDAVYGGTFNSTINLIPVPFKKDSKMPKYHTGKEVLVQAGNKYYGKLLDVIMKSFTYDTVFPTDVDESETEDVEEMEDLESDACMCGKRPRVF